MVSGFSTMIFIGGTGRNMGVSEWRYIKYDEYIDKEDEWLYYCDLWRDTLCEWNGGVT